jgi:hypothetical protein
LLLFAGLHGKARSAPGLCRERQEYGQVTTRLRDPQGVEAAGEGFTLD